MMEAEFVMQYAFLYANGGEALRLSQPTKHH